MKTDAVAAFARLVALSELGPRYVGAPGHERARELLRGWLRGADELYEHGFAHTFFGEPRDCRNIVARFGGERRGRVVLATHYDTRPWADRDPDEARRREPVPGANDGGSGTALLAQMAQWLGEARERPTLDLVFFDAEDWHDIDGNEVSLGASRFVEDLAGGDPPDAVVVADMIGGRGVMLDVDVNCQHHDPSYALTLELFQLGRSQGLPACAMKKQHPYKWIGCDHTPFQLAGIPAAILIDMDYPQWHTLADTPDACDAESLAQVARLLEAFVFGLR